MATSLPTEGGSAKQTLHARTKRDSKAAKTRLDGASIEAVSAEPIVTRTALIVRPFDTVVREKRVAEAAYYRAEQRGFAPGYEVADWLASEAEVDSELYRLYGEGRSF
jgi:hypothetical protein